ncbi:MAG: histidine phosphatase family protein [Gammaproteobacteria bacterium]|nr:histidine phosphatase family protein [Gammaproteobacteria bacterium]
MPTLYLMRHAKSDWHSVAKSDFDRPLNKRGSKDAVRMGQWLEQQGLRPEVLLASPAQRAKETVLAVADRLGVKANEVAFNKGLYLADRATLLKVLHTVPAATDSVLLVAHNPGMDDLVDWLATEPPTLSDSGKLMTTATIAIFEVSGSWAKLNQNAASLQALLRPKELV